MPNETPRKIQKLLESAKSSDVRFVKLGRRSCWWPISKNTSTIRLGFKECPHAACLEGEWQDVRRAFEATGVRLRKSDITRAVNQVRDFYTLPETALWFTIEDGDIWWGFSGTTVSDISRGSAARAEAEGARSRPVIGGWRNVDLQGEPLRLDGMTTKVTKVAAFQETICKPDGAADLLRRIRAEQSDSHRRTKDNRDALRASLAELLEQLHFKDFELLVELIFATSGWRRISAVGGTQKALDLVLSLPTTGENSAVQVKSQTDQQQFRASIDALENYSGYDRLFFV